MQQLSIESLRKLIPNYVIDTGEKLQQAGYEAYLVGGSLRDVLMGIVPNDYDIATNAYPEDIIRIFSKAIPTGAKFGTVTVVVSDEHGERFDIEVTTYRSEADYAGGRWPTKVEFTKTIQEDLSRRDFTINAMALNIQELDEVNPNAVQEILVDPFAGVTDLEKKLIKAVGNPLERFSEDGLRPVRACRLAAQLNFEIEPATFKAIKETNHVTKQVSVERFREELMKLLGQAAVPSRGIRLMKDSGILELFIPELLEGVNVTQPEFHADDVFEHSLKAMDAAEDSIKLAALFHDIGKPRTATQDEYGVHFYGHDQVGADMTKEIMQKLKFSNAEIDQTVRLVRWHMFYYPSADWRSLKKEEFDWATASKDEIQKHISDSKIGTRAGGWSDAAIRRLIQNVGGEEAVEELMKLRIADATSNPKADFNPEEVAVLAERIAEVRAKEMALKVTDLDISGNDLMNELEVVPGPKLGEVLQYLLEIVIEEPMMNKREELMRLAKGYLTDKN